MQMHFSIQDLIGAQLDFSRLFSAEVHSLGRLWLYMYEMKLGGFESLFCLQNKIFCPYKSLT